MTRISRLAVPLALTAVLLSAALPAAQARTLERHQSPSVSGSWFDAALGWLGGLGLGSSQTRTPVMKTTTPIPVPPPGGPLFGAHPMCGSGLDPQGHCGGTGG